MQKEKTVTTPKSSECDHPSLMFGSGGFYVICEACDGFWVANKNNGMDNDIDHSRTSGLVTTSSKRVKA